MVEIGRVGVKAGNAPIEQKISAYPPQADICAFVSTSPETKGPPGGPPGAPDGQNANGSGWLGIALGQTRNLDRPPATSGLPRGTDIFRAGRHVSDVPIGDIAQLLIVELPRLATP